MMMIVTPVLVAALWMAGSPIEAWRGVAEVTVGGGVVVGRVCDGVV